MTAREKRRKEGLAAGDPCPPAAVGDAPTCASARDHPSSASSPSPSRADPDDDDDSDGDDAGVAPRPSDRCSVGEEETGGDDDDDDDDDARARRRGSASSSSKRPRLYSSSSSPSTSVPNPPSSPSPLGDLSDKVFLAPMVRGSELASRTLARHLYGPDFLCYTPMLRSNEVVDAYHKVWKDRFHSDAAAVLALTAEDKLKLRDELREDAYLTVLDTRPSDSPLVAQLCGSDPSILSEAVKALLEIYDAMGNPLRGIDLNLGCPQECASDGGFGAFLAEGDPERAAECVRAMRDAIDAHGAKSLPAAAEATESGGTGRDHPGRKKPPPRLSAKIRLFDEVSDTIAFAGRLRAAGCESLTVHCRRREDKHDGAPDYGAGAEIVRALQEVQNGGEGGEDDGEVRTDSGISTGGDMPVVINGDVKTAEDARRVLAVTGASAVMVARGFLENPRALLPSSPPRNAPSSLGDTHTDADGNAATMFDDPAHLAAEYLSHTERYPPPSTLYVRKHLRWIFRGKLQPAGSTRDHSKLVDYTDWRPRLWTFLNQPYLETAGQFRDVVGLYCKLSGTEAPPSLRGTVEGASFKSIRGGSRKKKKKQERLITSPAEEC